MLEIHNAKVYDLKESIISCRNAMRLEMPEYTEEEFQKGLERMKKLVQSSKHSEQKCHDNALTGIRVSFDLKYTQYITKQFQRYHWFDYVSSSSLMHRITKMDFTKCVTKYVTQRNINEMRSLIALYNHIVEKHIEQWDFYQLLDPITTHTHEETKYVAWMLVVNNCPMGTELFVRVSTNYKQLQTIYVQRKNHKLKEDWGTFCKFVESLPYAKELILGQKGDE